MCGEKRQRKVRQARQTGSPPRVRGKEAVSHRNHRHRGITPACAGKRSLTDALPRLVKDHPRVCGEKRYWAYTLSRMVGSPPRVRGKDNEYGRVYRLARITPACAGKRNIQRLRITAPQDHPRVCGEKEPSRPPPPLPPGSPPRVRGKVAGAAAAGAEHGITPACAGKRLKKSHYCAIFVLPFSAVHSVYDRAQAPGNNLATPCGWTAAPEKSTRPGSQVYSLEHHPLRAEPDQADRGSG